MNPDHLLSLARETIDAVPTCLAITIDGNGDANARAINASKLTEDWTVRVMTDRRTRKFADRPSWPNDARLLPSPAAHT